MRALTGEGGAFEAIQAARREALAAFGDGTLYVERLIQQPRHIEFQILADSRGNVVHLYERECSLQRRHQKVIEETPSTAIDDSVRARMGEAAVAAAKACGYRNAGTIEFLVEGEGAGATFYFLEMNTRLQVEHPVTEQVLGVDLVHAQLAVAAGESVPWTQAALSQKGHAVECRIYAEDPSHGFLPQAGRLVLYREPSAPGLRIDSGFAEGDSIAVNYDPLIAKLIAHGESRDVTIARAVSALRMFPILGVKTNVPFLLRLLDDREFRAGRVHTGYIDEHQHELTAQADVPSGAVAAAAMAAPSRLAPPSSGRGDLATSDVLQVDPWSSLRDWGR